MYSVLATICLISAPEVCREVMLPVPQISADICTDDAEGFANDWAFDREDFDVKSSICQEMETEFEYSEVAPGVYVHEGQIGLPNAVNRVDLSNMGFVIGSESVAVFDSGGSRAVGEAALVGLRRITDLPISHVFLGHMHPDHIYGATVFAEAGARVVGHPNLAEALQARAHNYHESLTRLVGPEGFLGSEIPEIDMIVEGVQTFDLGGRILEVRSMETAHTNSDLVMIDQTTRTMFTSDLVFLHHTPALDGSLRGWQSEMKKLAEFDVDLVVPGHGPVTPFPEALIPTQSYLDVLAQSTKEKLDQGISLSEAAPLIAQSERPNWQLFDEFNVRNATGAYAEIEWE